MSRTWVAETQWGWVVQRALDGPRSKEELAGPFSTQEAAQAWLDGWTEGREVERTWSEEPS